MALQSLFIRGWKQLSAYRQRQRISFILFFLNFGKMKNNKNEFRI